MKNSWKCWSFVKIELLDKNLTFRIVCQKQTYFPPWWTLLEWSLKTSFLGNRIWHLWQGVQASFCMTLGWLTLIWATLNWASENSWGHAEHLKKIQFQVFFSKKYFDRLNFTYCRNCTKTFLALGSTLTWTIFSWFSERTACWTASPSKLIISMLETLIFLQKSWRKLKSLKVVIENDISNLKSISLYWSLWVVIFNDFTFIF